MAQRPQDLNKSMENQSEFDLNTALRCWLEALSQSPQPCQFVLQLPFRVVFFQFQNPVLRDRRILLCVMVDAASPYATGKTEIATVESTVPTSSVKSRRTCAAVPTSTPFVMEVLNPDVRDAADNEERFAEIHKEASRR